MKTKLQLQKKIAYLISCLLFASFLNLNAQCTLTASFSYTTGPTGAVYFNSTATGTNVNTTYRWNLSSAGLTGTNNPGSSTYTRTFVSNGTFGIWHAVINTLPVYCVDSVLQMITVSNVTCVASAPFMLQKDTNQNFTWNCLVTYPPDVAAIKWSFGDGSTSAILYPTHTYSAAGFYNVCLTLTNTCGGVYGTCTGSFLTRMNEGAVGQMITLNIVPDSPTEIANYLNNDRQIDIFPNPNQANFTIDFKGFEPGKEIDIRVYDMLGKELYTERFSLEAETKVKNLILSDVKSGCYLIKFFYDNTVKVSRLLISR